MAEAEAEGVVSVDLCSVPDAAVGDRSIADRLNSKGVRTRSGRLWSAMQVKRVYENYC